jgi:hypothetical protein
LNGGTPTRALVIPAGGGGNLADVRGERVVLGRFARIEHRPETITSKGATRISNPRKRMRDMASAPSVQARNRRTPTVVGTLGVRKEATPIVFWGQLLAQEWIRPNGQCCASSSQIIRNPNVDSFVVERIAQRFALRKR